MALLAVCAPAVGGCASSDEDEGGGDPSPSASVSADADGGGSSSPGGAGSPGPNDPTATVEWDGESLTFLLVRCDAEGPSSLEASGNTLPAGSIMTMRATDGAGQVLIQSDTSQEEESSGEFTSFRHSGGTFEGSGTYETSDGTAAFTMRGDCKDL